MKYKKTFLFIIIFLSILFIMFMLPNHSYADEISDIQKNMSGVSNPNGSGLKTDSGIGKAINIVIGLIQVAGTGISVIMVTIQGVKYIMASPSEKANVKNAAIPIVIGCVLLFAAVNVVKIIADTAGKLPS